MTSGDEKRTYVELQAARRTSAAQRSFYAASDSTFLTRYAPPLSSILVGCAFSFLVIIGITLTLVPLRASHDEFWHLKTGQWIAEHGLPEKEIFTYTASEYPWHNHEWLSQLAFWKIYEVAETNGLGGIRGLIVFKSLFITLTFVGLGVFAARRTGDAVLAALAAGLCCALGRRTFYPRPPFLTYGLMGFVLCLLLRWRDRKLSSPWLFILIPLFALWANLHGGFMAGLVVVGAFWLESCANWALAKWRMENSAAARKQFAVLTLLFGLCFAATFATPYGYHLYELAGRVMSDHRLDGIIAELLPPDWHFVWVLDGCGALLIFSALRPRSIRDFAKPICIVLIAGLVMRGLVPATAFLPDFHLGSSAQRFIEVSGREILWIIVLIYTGARSKERIGLAHTLLLLFFAHQAIQHVRHLPLFAVVLAPAMAQSLADWLHPGRELDFCTTLSPKLMNRAHWFAFGGQVLGCWLLFKLAVLYAFWPGEAWNFFATPSKLSRSELFAKSPSFFDRNLELLHGVAPEPGDYPVRAVDFLIDQQLPGRLWNGGNYAGYLIWRLSPEKYKVFTDNRYDIWGGAFIEDEHDVLNAFLGDPQRGLASWREILDKWRANTLLIPVEARLQHQLLEQAASPGLIWSEKYDDRAFAIWTRKQVLE